jgi:hypothetical protein
MPNTSLPISILQKNILNPSDYFFVDAGTNLGAAVQLALSYGFSKVFSVDIDEDYYKRALERFKGNEKVRLFLGDANTVFPVIIQEMNDTPAFYWLDAHSVEQATLNRNLADIVKRNNSRDIIAIDDIRIIRTKQYWGKDITIKDIEEILVGYSIWYDGPDGDIMLARKKVE